MNLTGDVSETGRAQVAEETDLTAGAGLAESDEIEPAVIVVIDGGDSKAAIPTQVRQLHALETFAFNIAPQADAGRACVGESQIHPSVFIEIERDDTNRWRKDFYGEVDGGKRGKLSFARIQKNRGALSAA